MANGRTFLGLGTGPGGGMTPATVGLMNFGQGLLAASTAPRAQRGALMAQAFNPAAMMEAKRRQDYYAMIEKLANPVIDESGATGAPPVAKAPSPMLGGPLVDLPGGGTAPGQVQTAMMAPAAPAAPAAAPRPRLTPQQAELLRMAGPEAGVGLMSQMLQAPAAPKPTTLMQNLEAAGFTPGTPEYQARAAMALPGATSPQSAIAKLEADRAAGLISAEQYAQGVEYLMKPQTQITIPKAQTPAAKINQDVAQGLLEPEEAERLKEKMKTYPQAQTKAASYANRMRQGDAEINSLMAAGMDPTSVRSNIMTGLPFGNVMVPEAFQKYEQAKGDWIRAKLRQESGAVIGDAEFAGEEKTYFPQIGDSDAVIKQKAEARRVATQNLIRESQGAYEDLYAPKPPPMDPADPAYANKTVRSDDGQRYRSDGKKWIKIQ